MDTYKILDSIWFGAIGIVAVDSNGHGWKCYIGNAKGYSQEADEQFVAMNGMPTGKSLAAGAFPRLDPSKHLN